MDILEIIKNSETEEEFCNQVFNMEMTEDNIKILSESAFDCFKLAMNYRIKDGNVWSEENLINILEIEKRILSLDSLTSNIDYIKFIIMYALESKLSSKEFAKIKKTIEKKEQNFINTIYRTSSQNTRYVRKK